MALNRGIHRYIQINGFRYTGDSEQMIIMFLNMTQRVMYGDSCGGKNVIMMVMLKVNHQMMTIDYDDDVWKE